MSANSVIDWHDGHEGYRCGYCKSPDTNYSHGMSAYNLTVNDYQDLIDRGWRRSGTYVYKPTMKRTCCPQYPIRCDALAFNLSRSHKKVIKRVNKYLNFGTIPDKDKHCDEVPHPSATDYPQRNFDTANINVESGNEVPTLAAVDRKLSPEAVENTSAAAAVQNSGVETVKHHQPKPGIGADPTKPKCMKAKLQRLEKKQLKAKTVVPTPDAVQTDCLKKTKVEEKKSLEDHLGDVIDTPVHKLEVRLVRSSPRGTEFDQHVEYSHGVYFKYQTVIHGDPPYKPTLGQYTRFLVESPLQQEAKDAVLPHGFGSFHQNYILDGKIIAVGVLDILPRCVSSVYLYYDPDYSFLSLGTYSALRELALTRELHRICPDISYYYLGFYIHSCPKMRYKGQYDPSYLLCPETYSWHKIDECRKKLDGQKYSRFAEAGIDDKDSDVEVNNVLVLHQRQVMSYGTYRSKKSKVTDKKSVSLYAHLVGNALTKRLLLYRS